MTEIPRRVTPFAVAAGVLALISIGLIRLPQIFVAQLERNRALDASQANWAFWLLVAVACAQVAFGGFSLLSVDRVAKTRATDATVAAMSRDRIVQLLGRTAAVMTGLTAVYGIASFVITGERGGFWLFLLIALAQLAWYYRQVGEVARWLSRQPEEDPGSTEQTLPEIPDDYCPPITRGLPSSANSGPD